MSTRRINPNSRVYGIEFMQAFFSQDCPLGCGAGHYFEANEAEATRASSCNADEHSWEIWHGAICCEVVRGLHGLPLSVLVSITSNLQRNVHVAVEVS